jgi:hypothetical protein
MLSLTMLSLANLESKLPEVGMVLPKSYRLSKLVTCMIMLADQDVDATPSLRYLGSGSDCTPHDMTGLSR